MTSPDLETDLFEKVHKNAPDNAFSIALRLLLEMNLPPDELADRLLDIRQYFELPDSV